MRSLLSRYGLYRWLRRHFPHLTVTLYRRCAVHFPLPPQRHPIQPYIVSGDVVKLDYGPCVCGCGIRLAPARPVTRG